MTPPVGMLASRTVVSHAVVSLPVGGGLLLDNLHITTQYQHSTYYNLYQRKFLMKNVLRFMLIALLRIRTLMAPAARLSHPVQAPGVQSLDLSSP